MTKRAGALVISLDFELHWGVRDLYGPNDSYHENLQGARTVIPKMLALFERYDIAATWATVGFLFARSKEELEHYSPEIKPDYENTKLDAYLEPLGESEATDPLHYAPSLIEQILQTPKQELSTHTFSHYYCLEKGQTLEAFRADLVSALAIAKTWQVAPRSIIFPRNQLNPDYVSTMKELGITIYRGNERAFMYQAAATDEHTAFMRLMRLADTYLPATAHNLTSWDHLKDEHGLINIPSSRFLRPVSSKLGVLEPLRLKRIMSGMIEAARTGQLYHLWWHPHNFGRDQEANLAFLEKILQHRQSLAKTYGFESLSMLDVAKRLE
ncbi:MAG: polysaccharide deacetylase family protein [Trueperaceae bacterium]|nr:polysaccharide deacetylase family protein [Trueperaceae bacterium]